MSIGIYTITSPSGGQYVGSALNCEKRWKQHIRSIKRGDHHSLPLQRAFAKYGLDQFAFKKIIICAASDMLMFEQRAIDILKPIYNICLTAGSNLGRKFGPLSAEQKAQIAATHTGRRRPPETGKRISEAKKGKPPSERQLRQYELLRGKPGRPRTDAERQHVSEVHLGRKRPPKSDEQRNKSSLAQKGKPRWSDEDKKRISNSLIGNKRSVGRILSEETKQKISSALKGRIQKSVSDETREKMSESAKARWIEGRSNLHVYSGSK